MRETLIIENIEQVEKLVEALVPNGYIVSIRRILKDYYVSEVTKHYTVEITDEIMGEIE